MGNTRDTGYLRNLVVYDGSGNIVLPANLTVTGSIVGYATTSYVTTQINNLINGAPGLLDTLDELAAALGDDANFASTLTTSLSGKQASLSGTGFVKISGTTISYDNSTYLTTASASSTYLPLAGGIMSGNISYGVGNGVAFYLQPQAAGGGPTNGAVLRLKSHAGAGALSDRSGALAWIDGNGVRLDLFEWNSSLINAYVPINGTSAVFSSTLNINSTLYVSSTATIAYNGLSGDFGAGYTTGLGVGYSSSVAKGINIGWNTTLDMGFIGSVHNGTGWKSLILCPIGGSVYIGATGNNNLYANSATFGSSVIATGLTTGTTGGSTISITTSNNAGTTGSPLQTKINFLGYNGNINGQIRVDDISSTAQVGSMQFYTWNSAQVLALTLAHTGAATFSGAVNTVGLLTGQASIYQSDAGGFIASNRWSVYNGGATTMRFLYNPSGDVIFDNGTPRLTLGSTGAATFSSTLQANGGNITSFSAVGVAGFGNGINIHTQAGTYTAGHGGILQFQNEDVITGGIRGIRDGGSWGGSLLFYTHNTSAGNTFNSTFVEGMRLTSNGNLLLGTVSDGVYRLDVQQGASNAAKFNFAVTGVWGGGANQDHGMLISGARHTSDTNTSLLHILNTDATSLFRVTDYGKVGINTFTPTATLDINGSVRYRGDIYDQFNFAASGNYTNGTYYNIVGVNAIPTGIYILQGSIDTYAAGGGIYFVSFVSVPFYMWDVGSNSTTFVDLPPVLGTGHHLGNAFPLFRLQMTLGGAGIYLQFNPNSTWAGMDNASAGKSFRVNLKRIG